MHQSEQEYPQSRVLAFPESESQELEKRLSKACEELGSSGVTVPRAIRAIVQACGVVDDEGALNALEGEKESVEEAGGGDEGGNGVEGSSDGSHMSSEEEEGEGRGSEDEEMDESEICAAENGEMPLDEGEGWMKHRGGADLVELYRNKRKWEEKENQRVKEKRKLRDDEKEARARAAQIFSSEQCFDLLAGQLFRLQKNPTEEIQAEAIDHDVHDWLVELGGFPSNSGLAHDLSTLESCYGYRSIQVRMRFKEDLHPFFPPTARVVRPRLQGQVAECLIAHPRLQFENWQPFLWTEVPRILWNFLAGCARVDVAFPGNDPDRCPEGAYSDPPSLVSFALAQLYACHGCLPSQFLRLYEELGESDAGDATMTMAAARCRSAARQLPSQQSEQHAKHYWNKGTGFGHAEDGHHEVWDPKAAEAAQQARDEQVQSLLEQIEEAMNAIRDNKEWSRAKEALESSTIAEVVRWEVCRSSFKDMCERMPFYSALFRTIDCILRTSARHVFRKEDLLYEASSITSQAYLFLRQCVTDDDTTTATTATDPSCSSTSEVGLANLVLSVCRSLESLADFDSAAKEESGPSALSKEQQYERVMAPYRICEAELSNHSFAGRAPSGDVQGLMRRVAKEYSSMCADLPVTAASSIFVRVDENRAFLWRALITGPPDTPYADGCFVFDICFPSGYPNAPPEVKFRTTGGGRVRFNPNLYHDGKVCLSLLNTWSGAQGENWDPKSSSILQVLVSIQSQIFVEDPYFNEPGFERQLGTESGKRDSAKYNDKLKPHTMELAILEPLRKPPPEFRDTICHHFRLKAEEVRSLCRSWCERFSNSHLATVTSLIDQELDKL